MHKAVDDTAKAGDGGSDLIANVAAGGNAAGGNAAGGNAAAGNGAKADKDSVTGIAKGMKAIVEAAKKAGVELKAADVAGDDGNDNDAGKLFANGNNGNAGTAADAQGAAEKAGEAVSAVSGDQILKAIVDAAGSTEGKSADTAKNAVEAAIGADDNAAAFGNDMQKKNQIAAAIVLRGLAKDGKFANANNAANGKVVAAKKASGWIKEMHKAVEDTAKAGTGSNDLIANVAAGGNAAAGAGADKDSVTGIAKGMKAIVEAAKKAGVELKADAADGGGNDNDAGRLFASGNNGNAGGDDDAQGAAEKAGEAVSAVSGDQILKAIVDAAKKAGVELKADDAAGGGNDNDAGRLFASGAAGADDEAQAQGAAEKAGEAVSAVSGDQILKAIVDAAGSTEGKRANTATNAVEAAIGADGDGAAFGDANMKKKNQIAAAIVLRGLAKGGKFANTNAGAANGTKVKAAVKSAVGWIKEMHKAVEDTAKAGTGSNESIANVAAGGGAADNAGDGAKANAGSVTGIAKGMKAIVEAAKKAGVELKADDVDGGAGNNAGRLFASGAAVDDNDAQGAAEKAGEAVSAVSGDQILKAIVDAAESTEGKGAAQAKDAVEAAIGGDNNAEGVAFGNDMKKKNQIAAAIVLRGLAKGGKFANANAGDANGAKVKAAVNTSEWIKEMKKAVEDTAKAGTGGSESIANVAAGGAGAGDAAGAGANKDSVTGIAKGMKAIVEAAKKAGVELKADDAAGGGAGNNAGRLFANGNNAGAADAAQGAAEKAGEAVSAVSGDQILKAIVDAAGTTEGKGAGDATNAVEAAIGGDNNGAAGVAFADGNMKKNQIAAAIVLRGLAKGGKFANTNDGAAGANGKVKAAVKSAVGWIKEMHKAVEDTAKAGTGSNDLIANVAAGGADAAGNGAKADKGSVTGIAKGMKAIVEAAKKAGVEFKPDDVADVANGDAAGRLFASGNNGNAGGEAQAQGAAEKAGEAVSAVSGDQILKAIIDAAGSTAGKGAGTAKDAVEAAIGGGNDGAAGVAFGDNMKKNQIAAAIVLRGLAKGGKFANTNVAGGNGKVVAAVKSAVGWIKEMHKAVEDTAKAGDGGNESIANVAAGGGGANGNGAKANAGSVTGIAKGMKAIVDAAKKAGVELKADAADGADAGGNDDAGRLFASGAAGAGGNDDAGRLFASGANAHAGANADAAQEAAEKAGEAVSAVSGDQILKAIVDAAESTEGKGAGTAKDAVEAAIGGDGEGAAFAANMKKNQIAAAIVLRGVG
ncbi:variable large family protein [Borreliella burgdorferi]|uniref:variable large family protein n=1 Tax=Borreliella burgdorferi TaxID=139 RepID=UPI000D032932|nr:variable large family protein [Borreliella burgdorferi]